MPLYRRPQVNSDLADVIRIIFDLLLSSFYQGLIGPRASDKGGCKGLPGRGLKRSISVELVCAFFIIMRLTFEPTSQLKQGFFKFQCLSGFVGTRKGTEHLKNQSFMAFWNISQKFATVQQQTFILFNLSLWSYAADISAAGNIMQNISLHGLFTLQGPVHDDKS